MLHWDFRFSLVITRVKIVCFNPPSWRSKQPRFLQFRQLILYKTGRDVSRTNCNFVRSVELATFQKLFECIPKLL